MYIPHTNFETAESNEIQLGKLSRSSIVVLGAATTDLKKSWIVDKAICCSLEQYMNKVIN